MLELPVCLVMFHVCSLVFILQPRVFLCMLKMFYWLCMLGLDHADSYRPKEALILPRSANIGMISKRPQGRQSFFVALSKSKVLFLQGGRECHVSSCLWMSRLRRKASKWTSAHTGSDGKTIFLLFFSLVLILSLFIQLWLYGKLQKC